MDADTRHQLKQNELAEALAKLRQFSDPKFRYALAALGVIIVLVLGAYAWRYSHNRTVEKQWRTLSELAESLDANDPATVERAAGDLRNFIQESSDPALAAYARLQLASTLMNQALLNSNRRPAGFQEAASLLKEIVAQPPSPALEAAATFALATAYESQREFDEARKLYVSLTDESRFAGLPFSGLARDRLSSLDSLSDLKPLTPGGPPIVVVDEDPALQGSGPNQPVALTPVAAPPAVPPAPPVEVAPSTQPAGPTAPPASSDAAPQPPSAP